MRKMKMARTVLAIDGDIVAYQAAAAAEQPIYWGEGLWTMHAWEQDVERHIDDFVAGLKESAETDEVITALSDTANFRKSVAHYYKANRTSNRKPMLLNFAKEYIRSKHNGVVWENLEADDVLGILGSSSDEYLIWSIDKDLKTVRGRHLIDGVEVTINESEADYWFFYQTLVGDATDNYPGCPTVGPKTAEKLLAKDASWDTVVAAFAKQGLSEEVALEQARLARILRAGEYDNSTGDVKLWEPNASMKQPQESGTKPPKASTPAKSGIRSKSRSTTTKAV